MMMMMSGAHSAIQMPSKPGSMLPIHVQAMAALAAEMVCSGGSNDVSGGGGGSSISSGGARHNGQLQLY